VLFGLLVAFGPATGIVTTIALFGCAIIGAVAFWILFASFGTNSKRNLEGLAIEILLNILINR
jgi:hypothetical protein